MPIEILQALYSIHEDSKVFKPLMVLVNSIIVNNKDMIVGLVSDVSGTDDAIRKTSSQNYYRGKTSSLSMLHGLIVNAGEEIQKREARSKSGTK